MTKQNEIEQVQILNVRLPSDVVSWLDSLVLKGLYSSKSEALRDFMREYVQNNRTKND